MYCSTGDETFNIKQIIQADVSAEDSYEYCELLQTLESEYQQLRDLSAGRMLDMVKKFKPVFQFIIVEFLGFFDCIYSRCSA